MFFKARRDGTIQLQLDPVVREVVARACGELRDNLLQESDDPTLRRLFPPAYPDDAEREQAYERLVRGDLMDSRLDALDTVVATVDEEHITAEDAQKWMAALNALRLTLGTRLDVTEDQDPLDVDEHDPRYPQFMVYDLLGVLLGSLVAAVSD